MRMHLFPIVAIAALISAACGGGADRGETQTSEGVAEESPTVGSRSSTDTGASASAAKLDDPTIVAIFDAANTADMESGTLAAERGSTKEIRDFGAMLARDHKGVRQQGRDLAAKLNVTPTPPANDASAKAHEEAMKSLRSKQGVEFDRAFLDHEIAYHQGVIDAVTNTLLPSIQNDELQALVEKVAPAFVAHRDAAVKLREKLDK